MTVRVALRLAMLMLGLTVLAGCSAISSIQSASTPLNTYELSPLPAGTVPATRGQRHLEVALPTATGALTSDRIVIKPTPLQVQSLPDARWVNETIDHVQLLLVRSLANSGRFALVTGAGTGPAPDYVLLTDLLAFQAEVVGDGLTVVIQTRMTVLSDTDGRVISSRSFSTSRPAADSSADQVASAFDAAMTQQLTEVITWLVGIRGV